MVVAEDTTTVPYSVSKEVAKSPRLACDEFQRLLKIVRMKGLKVSESQLILAVYTGRDLFFDEGVESE